MTWKPGERVTLETERTIIRSMTISDITDRVVGWFADPDVMKFVWTRLNYSRRRLRKWVSSHDNESRILLGMFAKDSNLQIGWSQIRCSNGRGFPTRVIGDHMYRARGYGYETGLAVYGFLFECLKLHKVHTTVYAENTVVHALNKKFGFRLEGVLREHTKGRDGTWHDIHVFGMLAEEWSARKEADDGNPASSNQSSISTRNP